MSARRSSQTTTSILGLTVQIHTVEARASLRFLEGKEIPTDKRRDSSCTLPFKIIGETTFPPLDLHQLKPSNVFAINRKCAGSLSAPFQILEQQSK